MNGIIKPIGPLLPEEWAALALIAACVVIGLWVVSLLVSD